MPTSSHSGHNSHKQTEGATLLTHMIILSVFMMFAVYYMISLAVTNSTDFENEIMELAVSQSTHILTQSMCYSFFPLDSVLCFFSTYIYEINEQLICRFLHAVRSIQLSMLT